MGSEMCIRDRARQVILLADSRKWGKVSFSRVSGFDNVDVLITDKKFPAKDARILRKQDVKVRLV